MKEWELALMLLRMALHVAAAVALIVYAEQLLGCLIKDLVAKQPPEPLPETRESKEGRDNACGSSDSLT